MSTAPGLFEEKPPDKEMNGSGENMDDLSRVEDVINLAVSEAEVGLERTLDDQTGQNVRERTENRDKMVLGLEEMGIVENGPTADAVGIVELEEIPPVTATEPAVLSEPAVPTSFLSRLPTLDFRTVPKLQRGQGIPFPLVILLAVASCITVSNLYITQPLLLEIAEDFNATKSEAASLVSLSQAGYCLGLILITPLGDVMPRRLLVIALTAVCSFLTAMEGLSPNIPVFQVLQFFVGAFTVVPQIVIPTVADVSPSAKVSQNVGLVVGMTLIGTLYGRVVSGAIAAALGWRFVFYIATATQVAVLVLLVFFFPQIPLTAAGVNYAQMLISVWTCIRTTSVLRQSTVIAFFCYVGMTCYWTTTVFLMGGSIYNLPVSTIGLLGLAGIGGILAAPLVGFLPFKPHTTIILGVSIQLLSFILAISAGTKHVSVLFVSAFLMDFGRQLQQLSNQIRIYSALPNHKSRANAAYMTGAYLGTFVGVSLGTLAYEKAGWTGSCAVGMGALGVAAIAWLWVDVDGRVWYDRLRAKKNKDVEKTESMELEHGKSDRDKVVTDGDVESNETTVDRDECRKGNKSVIEISLRIATAK
jgi:predicted MFS family arabinose efflux permease